MRLLRTEKCYGACSFEEDGTDCLLSTFFGCESDYNP